MHVAIMVMTVVGLYALAALGMAALGWRIGTKLWGEDNAPLGSILGILLLTVLTGIVLLLFGA